ncbi:hypothetical protein BDK51DRAFT_30476 [Blyttiomyces helicus]|uniref:Uncharacterized protein n=1 Tax=Blyttiomyces helicus TaxID=388810 RepID=A0A4P9WLT4_9FUNG|nr:hypothetical protein BDK51DRAFT_30476 [Blyttiomyces helicus]|eukprot:RKO91626.1 hypothetical protein BDK51DRAFT_30476 [Blyttiomyces helicus]
MTMNDKQDIAIDINDMTIVEDLITKLYLTIELKDLLINIPINGKDTNTFLNILVYSSTTFVKATIDYMNVKTTSIKPIVISTSNIKSNNDLNTSSPDNHAHRHYQVVNRPVDCQEGHPHRGHHGFQQQEDRGHHCTHDRQQVIQCNSD